MRPVRKEDLEEDLQETGIKLYGFIASSVAMTGGVVSVSIVMYLLVEEDYFFLPIIAAVEGLVLDKTSAESSGGHFYMNWFADSRSLLNWESVEWWSRGRIMI